MDTHIDGSVLAVLAAYQNNLVTSKMMTSGVVQWFPTLTSENTSLDGKELKRIRADFAPPLPSIKMSIPMICIA